MGGGWHEKRPLGGPPRVFGYFLSPGFPPTPYLQPQARAPIQSLTLALSSERASETAVAALAEGAAPIRSQISISGRPSPGLSCRCFISQEPRCAFSSGAVFLEVKSSSALRGTNLWMWHHLEPNPDWRRVGTGPQVSPAPLGPFCWIRDTLHLPCPARLLPAQSRPGGLVGRAREGPRLWQMVNSGPSNAQGPISRTANTSPCTAEGALPV